MAIVKHNNTGRRGLRWLAYGLFTLAALVVGLVVTLPLPQVADRLSALATQQLGWHITVADPQFALPIGVATDRIRLQPPGDGDAITVRDVRVHAVSLGWGDEPVTLSHSAAAFGGQVAGTFTHDGTGNQPAMSWNGNLERVQLDQIPLPLPGMVLSPQLNGMAVSGELGGTLETAWRGNEMDRGNGRASVVLGALSVTIPNTPLGALTLPLGEISIRADWQRGRVDVADFTVEGDVVSGRGSGSIRLGPTARTTRLNLRFTGMLEPGFPMRDIVIALLGKGDSPVQLTVTGTLAQPGLLLNGRPLQKLMGG